MSFSFLIFLNMIQQSSNSYQQSQCKKRKHLVISKLLLMYNRKLLSLHIKVDSILVINFSLCHCFRVSKHPIIYQLFT